MGIFLSNPVISLQRSKVSDHIDNQKLKKITDTLEKIENYHTFDSLLARTDTMKYFHLYCMGRDYAQMKPSLSKTIADSLLIHSEKDNYLRGIISAYNLRGIIFTYEDNYVNAVTNLKEAIKIGKTNKESSELIRDKYGCTLYYLGDLYFKKNDYKVAIDYYRRSLDIFESFSDYELQQEDLNFLLTSIAFTTIREDKAYAMYSVGRTYLKLDEIDSSKKYLANSLHLAKETKYDRLEAMVYFSLSELHLSVQDTASAKKYLEKSIHLSLFNNLNEYIIYGYLMKMEIDLAQKNYKQMEFIYKKLLSLTTIMNMRSEKAKTHQLYSEYLYAIGNSIDAYVELDSANQIRLKLADDDKSREFGQLEAGIKYQQSLYDLELKSIKAKEEEKRLTSQLYYSLAVVVLLILIAVVVLLYARKNKQLSAKLSIANDELEVANTQLTELNDTKTKLFRIISHDLKNPIKEFDKGVKYMIKNSNEGDYSNNTTYLQSLGESASNIYNLLNSLLQWAEAQFKDTSIIKAEIDIKKVLDRIIALHQTQIEEKSLDIIAILDTTRLISDPNIFQIVIRNIIQNSIKFTSYGGSITISSQREDDFTIIEIKDTGQGMAQEQIDAILSNQQFNINYDDVRTGAGLGLRAVKDYIDQLGGNIFIESTPGNGTTITIYFS